MILDFFKKENWAELEVKKFFNHYQGIGWEVGGRSSIVDWQATSKSWILKAEEMKISTRKKTNINSDASLDHFSDNLHVKENKCYDIPL